MNMLKPLVIAAALAAMGSANATIAVVYDDFDDGLANFNSTVAAAGGTATHDVWNTTATNRGDYTVSKGITGSIYTLWNSSPTRTMSGYYVDISPAGSPANGNDNGAGTKASGVSLEFVLGKEVNAIGFEVGDWSTCCQNPESNIYISFDNNAPIMVGTSDTFGSGFLTNRGAGVFVAAFDDTGTFSKVTFWGDGIGEYLVMGGTIHYATLDEGSLPASEPASLALLGLGLAGLGFSRRRKTA